MGRVFRRLVVAWGILGFLAAQAAAAPKKKAPPKPGFVVVDSPLEGATIEIDGTVVGTTPAPPISVPAGQHGIKVSRRGYLPVLDVVIVKPGQETKFTADLFAEKCILKVTSPVEAAEVYLDGKLVGETPVDTDIDPGRRSLRVSAQGYRDMIKVIEAVAGEELVLDAPLESLTPTPVAGTPSKKGKQRTKAWYKKWWVWAIAGGVATATVVGVAATSGDDNPIDDFDPDRRFDIP